MARDIMITGAGGGIGGALTHRLLARGDRVIAVGLTAEELADVASHGATPVMADVGDDASVAAAFAGIDRLDSVVHCAAIAPLGTVEFTLPDVVARVHNINVLGTVRVMQAALPLLRAAPHGRLVLLSSLWGRVSGPFVSAYAASKHAVEALADAARREMRGQGVHISLIQPGVVRTPMLFSQLAQLDAAIAALGGEEGRIYRSLYADHRKLVAGAEKTAIPAERCAAIIEKCLDAPKPAPRYCAGPDSLAMKVMDSILGGRGLDRVFGLMYRNR